MKKISRGMVSPDNDTARELSVVGRRKAASGRSTKLHNEYLAHPTAQYTMTFAQWKRRRIMEERRGRR